MEAWALLVIRVGERVPQPSGQGWIVQRTLFDGGAYQ